MIRLANHKDIKELARLCSQLGYESSEEQVESRLHRILHDLDHAVFVFEQEVPRLAGWVHVYGKHLIESEYAEIGGLVVDQNSRRQKIGERLMRKCEEWATENGYSELRLRSGGHRKEAHAFYKQIGYENVKSQQVFTTNLEGVNV
ncbi:GNAT family N-acetyltransferase [Fictibacillus barbaricus]|uniref:GNAT superfamily N-acetyltransferase n=1 Tax=Fictibacillus barbaricus TaxID=182136 RepID=A0ABU1TWF9_9BACL|nr:GNAT family N-acetyltransferase [Fictibacillus barbaricus]MDR7071543.1 GNAT superfamily N-acetyltransferase [Fictibacillus barbaricus]